MRTLRVKNWQRFQHYKAGRNPPWIKLHFELLMSRDWVVLDDTSRLLAIVCMLVASRHGGEVPDDPTYLQRIAHMKTVPNFKPLIDAGFLVAVGGVQADAITVQADARIEKKREDTEEIREEERESGAKIPRAKARARTQLPPDFELNEVMRGFAHARGYSPHKMGQMFEAFCNHHRAHGNTMADWPAAWRTWVSNEGRFNRNGGGQRGSITDAAERVFNDLATGEPGHDQGGGAADILRLPRR